MIQNRSLACCLLCRNEQTMSILLKTFHQRMIRYINTSFLVSMVHRSVNALCLVIIRDSDIIINIHTVQLTTNLDENTATKNIPNISNKRRKRSSRTWINRTNLSTLLNRLNSTVIDHLINITAIKNLTDVIMLTSFVVTSDRFDSVRRRSLLCVVCGN